MNIEWKFNLPTNEKSEDYEYESPIFYKDGKLYFVSTVNETALHIVNVDNGEEEKKFACARCSVLPSKFFFLGYQDKVIFYTGELWIYEGLSLSHLVELKNNDKINSHVLYKNRFIFASASYLYCFNLDSLSLEWYLGITNTNPYCAGDISLFENTIACYGKDQLLFVDIEQGVVTHQIKIPKIKKLFHPIKLDDDTILLGYTNWSNAGILKYNIKTKEVLWKSKRSFEGPQLKCKIYRKGNFVYWVKNGTELICLNTENGEEEYRVRTVPWLYTDLLFFNDSILFGTAGRDGGLISIDTKSGKENWSVFLKNGCAFFDVSDGTVLVGDFSKRIFKIDIANGEILQSLQVDGEVVGDIKVYQNYAYTVIWGNEEDPISLIKIRI